MSLVLYLLKVIFKSPSLIQMSLLSLRWISKKSPFHNMSLVWHGSSWTNIPFPPFLSILGLIVVAAGNAIMALLCLYNIHICTHWSLYNIHIRTNQTFLRKKLYYILWWTKLVKPKYVSSVCKILPSESTKTIGGVAVVSSQELVRKREKSYGWLSGLVVPNNGVSMFIQYSHLRILQPSGDRQHLRRCFSFLHTSSSNWFCNIMWNKHCFCQYLVIG